MPWPAYNFGPALVATTTTTTTTPAPPTQSLYHPYVQSAYPSTFNNAFQFNPMQQQAAIPYFNPYLQPAQSAPVKVEEKKEEKKEVTYGRAPIDLYSLMSMQKGRAFANQPVGFTGFPGMQGGAGYGGGYGAGMGGMSSPFVGATGQGFNNPYGSPSSLNSMYQGAPGGGAYGGMGGMGGMGGGANADPTAGMSIFGGQGAGMGGYYGGSGMGGMGGLQSSGSSAYPQYGQPSGGYGASIYNRNYGGYPSTSSGYGGQMGGNGLLGAMSSGVASWLNPFRAPLSLFGF